MGLKDMLTTQGSPLSKANGGNIPTPIGATDQSKLQYTYSINGTPNVPNKPQPSQLDLNGINPTGPNSAPGVIPINNTFSNGTYRNSAPSTAQGRI
jgi:hypothetical protein